MSDYISREAAMKAIKSCESADWFIMNWGLIKAMNAVGDIPAADVRPVKHGKWEECGGVGGGWHFWRCTNCGAVGYKEFYFCPNCGAKMEAEGGE